MRRKEKVLFLVTPGRRHLIVELDEPYDRRELAVLLAAFRRRMTGDSATAGQPVGSVDRVVGPGFVIDMPRRPRQR